jgi:uncharacterized membrane protein
MDLQNTFYTLAIIFMILGIILLIGIAVLLFYIKNKISDIHENVNQKINKFVEPAEIAMGIGSVVAEGAAKKVRKLLKGK